MGMSVNALVTMEEYLQTAYSPDREYVDGVIVERHVGERPHSLVQANIVFALRQRYPGIYVWPELRVRTVSNRSRVPDICVTLEDPGTDVLETHPFIAIEILSRRDEMSNVIEKLEEYAAIQTPYIWLLDPRRKKAFTFSGFSRLEEITGKTLSTTAGEIWLTTDEAFLGL
jgi:Uma2 family endonuclease